MRFKCSQCGEQVENAVVIAGTSVVCPHCQAKLRAPKELKGMAKTDKVRSAAAQPIILPVLLPSDDPGLTEEKRKDLEETRQYRKEDRAGNGIGAAGFAIGLTTLIFLFSAAALHKEIPIYLVFASCVSVPTALLGLMCSIIGCLRKGRPKFFSLFGVALGAFLVLAALPGAFTMLKHGG